MRFISLTALIILSLCGIAQTTYNKFQWETSPLLHTVNKKFSDEAAVFIKENKVIEYAIEKDGFFTYKTVHRIIHINNDKGIEMFNKVYLPFNEGIQMMDVKARTILPGGKVVHFDEKNIKEIKDDDNTYKIFALDGLTKGCEVEYYYTLKKYPSFFGREVTMANIPVQVTNFELISPSHLIFETKSFNGLPECKDTIQGEKRYLRSKAEELPALPEEKYTMRDANFKRIEYKLSFNQAKNASERLFTWNELAKKAFDVYTDVSDKEIKKIKDLVANAGVNASMTDNEKIVLIEIYLKKNFINREDVPDEDAQDLAKVIKNKVASNKAFCKLFCAAFGIANVTYQIVFAGDRENYMVDRSFENWSNAQNLVFFFPSTRKYMAPTQTVYRYPWIPPTWASTNGLFCISTTIGNFRTAIAEVKNIPMEAYEHTYLNLDVKTRLDKEGNALILDIKQSYCGYAAPNYKAPFVFYPAEEQTKMLKELIKFGTNSENILSHSFENKEIDQKDPYQPFVINATVRSAQMVEKAGDKIIIKIGEIIGQQSEMYNTKDRTSNVDLEYPHAQVRIIEFTIPDGYEIKNLKDLNFNQVFKEKDKLTMGFVCTHEFVGKVLRIKIQEDYTKILYTVPQFAAFMKIINTAADFNTTVLVLDKKK